MSVWGECSWREIIAEKLCVFVESSTNDQLSSYIKDATSTEGCRSSESIEMDKSSMVVIKGNKGNHDCGEWIERRGVSGIE